MSKAWSNRLKEYIEINMESYLGFGLHNSPIKHTEYAKIRSIVGAKLRGRIDFDGYITGVYETYKYFQMFEDNVIESNKWIVDNYTTHENYYNSFHDTIKLTEENMKKLFKSLSNRGAVVTNIGYHKNDAKVIEIEFASYVEYWVIKHALHRIGILDKDYILQNVLHPWKFKHYRVVFSI